ncbi:unnamed protein product [Allacma fusca]|uniref:BED-type domain-containing protein n=1 Tax=Allacma fusca TaxID=39272 RepID=A0A8J2JU90_9HEXA|nr:unnamed protein product [Allacma fusca]
MDVVEILSSEELSLDDEIPSNLDILKQRKSGIYQQFVWNEEKKKFQCNHCKNFFVQKCKSTGNLWKHYNRCAKPLINNPRHNHNDNTSGRITKFFKPQLEGFDKDELENKLLDFVIMTDQPFSILEDPSFIAFAVYGRPIDGLFSSTTLKRRLLQRYEGLTFDMQNQHVKCLAHVVNLACKDAMSVLKNISVKQLQSPIINEESDYDNSSAAEYERQFEKSGDRHYCENHFIVHVSLKGLNTNSWYLIIKSDGTRDITCTSGYWKCAREKVTYPKKLGMLQKPRVTS